MVNVLEKSLDRSTYVDDATWIIEKRKVFAANWFCVGRHEQVGSDSGSYKLFDLQGENVLIVRGSDGLLTAFVNICPHRGTELVDSTDASSAHGCFGAVIRCPYHNWTFNIDGSLRGAPYLDPTEADEAKLLQLELELWGGFIFVRQISGGASLQESLAEISHRVKNYPLSELIVGRSITYEVAANWKVIEENYNECYHCGPVHPELCDLVPSFRAGGAANLDWDRGIAHRDGAYTFTKTGTTSRRPFAGLSESELVNHKGDLVYPNLFLSLSCDHVASFVLWPKGPAHTTVICDFLFHPSEIVKTDFDPSDAAEFWDVVNLQDWKICERVQRGMMSKFFTQGSFAPMETPSLDIRNWWREQMNK